MEIINNENLSGLQTLFGITQMFGIILVILIVYWSLAIQIEFGFNLFTWHPFLMIIGMIYLQGSSILEFREFRNAHRKSLKLAHASIHAVALVFVILATVAIYQSNIKSYPPIPNLCSIHSWIGALASTFFLIQWIASFITFPYPGLPSVVNITIMQNHVFFRLTIFILACVAAVLGFGEFITYMLVIEDSKHKKDTVLINYMAIMVVIFAVLVVFLTTNINYQQYPCPKDRELLNRSSGLSITNGIHVLKTELLNRSSGFPIINLIHVLKTELLNRPSGLSITNFLYPGLYSKAKITVMSNHMLFKSIIFILACVAAVLWFNKYAIVNLGTAYSELEKDAIFMYSMVIIVVIFIVLGVFSTTNKNYKRYPRPKDKELLNRSSGLSITNGIHVLNTELLNRSSGLSITNGMPVLKTEDY